jgi:ankyrin repeat protein
MVSLSQNLIARTDNGATRIDELDGDGRTALFCAVENEHLEVAKLLLEAGADIATKNRHGQTLMTLAAARERGKMETLLWRYRASRFKGGVVDTTLAKKRRSRWRFF